MKRILISLLIACAGTLLAQDQDPGGQPPPPSAGQPGPDNPGQQGGQYEPGRAVARISILNGDVSVRRGDSGDVVAAVVNNPIMADDRVLTGASARAEVQLDFGNVVRIAPNSEVRFVGMDMKSFQLQVATGSVTFRVLRPSQAQAEVDTPSVAMHPLRQGAYRVTVNEDGTSQITVRSGEAEIYSQNGSEHLQAGQTMNARGAANDPEFQVVQAIAPDAWDRWNDERDRLLLRSQSYRYVSPQMPGAEDLDQNGQWNNDPTYGNVWQPNVQPGWSPYSNGRWVWEDWYGWTWVSYDSWGWAPYHYGRWFMGAGGWAWYPGPIYGNYFWSPALVGFFGFGGGFGVGFGFGGIGWVPLAPFEVFHPWWGRGFYGGYRTGVFNHTSIVNNVNVGSTYRNARVAGGAIGTNTADFGRRGGYSALNSGQLQSAGLVHGALPVSPDRASLRATDRAAGGNSAQSRNQSFASHTQAARVDRVSFDQQQRGVQQMSRSNLSSAGRTGAGNAGASGSSGASHGWSRFGEPIHGANGAAGGQSAAAARGSYGGYNGSSYARPSPYAGSSRGAYGGSGQAVRINPSIVQQRSSGGYAAPRSAPSYGGGRPSSPAPRSSGGGGARPSGGGGGGHASGGGHGGGGHR